MPLVRLYQNDAGLMRITANLREEAKYGPLPDTTLQLAFDTATNPGRLADIRANRNLYALGAGPPVRLLRQSVPVTLAAPGPLLLIRAKVFNGLPLSDAERNALDRLLFRLLADTRED